MSCAIRGLECSVCPVNVISSQTPLPESLLCSLHVCFLEMISHLVPHLPSALGGLEVA